MNNHLQSAFNKPNAQLLLEPNGIVNHEPVLRNSNGGVQIPPPSLNDTANSVRMLKSSKSSKQDGSLFPIDTTTPNTNAGLTSNLGMIFNNHDSNSNGNMKTLGSHMPNLNIIDGNGKPHMNELAKFLKNDPFAMGKIYNLVSVIGCQSTGKSTLLNEIFGTNFQTLDQQYGRQQTTKGIVISKCPFASVFVLDIEGTDSNVHANEGQAFENSTSLFALVMSQVLIINMLTMEVGRYIAANYEILKVILDNNMKLFEQEGKKGKKTIVFTLRDYNEDENLEKLRGTLISDLRRIWSEIPKTRQHRNSTLEQVFNIEIIPIYHYKYNRTRFHVNIEELRKAFIEQAYPRYFFKGYDYNNNNLLINDLAIYMEQIWKTIRECKDINIPSQKTLISMIRCTDIKTEIIQSLIPDIETMKLRITKDKPIYEGLIIDINRFIKTSIERYNTMTIWYDKEIMQKIQTEFYEKLVGMLNEIWFQYTIILKKYTRDGIQNDLHLGNLSLTPSKRSLGSSYENNIKDWIRVIEENWHKRLKDLLHYRERIIGLDKKIDQTYDECKAILKEILSRWKEEQANLRSHDIIKINKHKAKQMISQIFNNIDVNFWTDLLNLQKSSFSLLENMLNDSLIKELDIDQHYYKNILNDANEELKNEMDNMIRERLIELPLYMTKRFRRMFTFDNNGLPINWKKHSIQDINTRFLDSRHEIEKIINIIKNQQPMNDLFYQSNTSELDTVNNIAFDRNILKTFDEFKSEYEEALRKHNMSDIRNMPKWIVSIMFLFIYKDIIHMLETPVLYFPALFISGFAFLCLTTGINSLPNLVIDKVIALIKVFFGKQLAQLGFKI